MLGLVKMPGAAAPVELRDLPEQQPAASEASLAVQADSGAAALPVAGLPALGATAHRCSQLCPSPSARGNVTAVVATPERGRHLVGAEKYFAPDLGRPRKNTQKSSFRGGPCPRARSLLTRAAENQWLGLRFGCCPEGSSRNAPRFGPGGTGSPERPGKNAAVNLVAFCHNHPRQNFRNWFAAVDIAAIFDEDNRDGRGRQIANRCFRLTISTRGRWKRLAVGGGNSISRSTPALHRQATGN